MKLRKLPNRARLFICRTAPTDLEFTMLANFRLISLVKRIGSLRDASPNQGAPCEPRSFFARADRHGNATRRKPAALRRSHSTLRQSSTRCAHTQSHMTPNTRVAYLLGLVAHVSAHGYLTIPTKR